MSLRRTILGNGMNGAHLGFLQSQSDLMTIAVDFSPRITEAEAPVAERRLRACKCTAFFNRHSAKHLGARIKAAMRTFLDLPPERLTTHDG